MKHSFSTLCIYVTFISVCFSQDYISYFNLCNEGDRLIYEKQYAQALSKFDKAFKLVDYVHANQFDKAASCAALVSDFKKCVFYLKRAALNGMDGVFQNNRKAYSKAKKSTEYKSIQDSLPVWRATHNKNINIDYAAILDSLHFVDQRIIRGNRSLKYDKQYHFPKSMVPENKFELDDAIFDEILRLIDTYGFPSEKLVGPNGYADAYIILHHNFRRISKSQYMALAIQAVKSGEYLPKDFAWMYDQFHNAQGKPLVFYYGFPVTDKGQIKSIDKKRAEYGIKPLAATPTKVRGKKMHTYITKHLW